MARDEVFGITSPLAATIAGSIGRTDLAGGDHEAMMRSLRDVVLPLADDTLILPGHGPATTMERERATNPYLKGL